MTVTVVKFQSFERSKGNMLPSPPLSSRANPNFHEATPSVSHHIHPRPSPCVSVPVGIYFGSVSSSSKDTTAQGKTHTLHKRSQNLTTSLQQRMSHDNLQKLLQPRAPPLNHIVAKSIGKHFSRQRGDGHARTLPLQYVAEVFEIRVSAADAALAQLEGGDVGAAEDLVVRVHGPADAVGSGVANLDAAKGLGLVTAQVWP